MSSPTDPGGWPDPSPPPGQPSQHDVPPPPPYPGAGPTGYGYGGYPPPGYPPPGYPPPGYPLPGYPPPSPKTNSLGVAAMVVSISSAVLVLCAFCLTFVTLVSLGGGITGTVLGFVARRQIRERGEQGDGMALTGIIVGLVAAVLGLLGTILMVIWLGFTLRYDSSFS